MNAIIDYFHTYMLCLLRPYKVHDWLRFNVAPWNDAEVPEKPALAESIAVSWVFAIIQGLSKITLAAMILKFLIQFQEDSGFGLIDSTSEMVPYYMLVFSTALDIVFFPVLTLIVTQFWNFVVRGFAYLLGVTNSEERQSIADDVTVVALSSNFFLCIPVLGIFLQKMAWYFLMYSGLRKNLGAGPALSFIILFTPTVVMLMVLSFIALVIFYLFAAGA